MQLNKLNKRLLSGNIGVVLLLCVALTCARTASAQEFMQYGNHTGSYARKGVTLQFAAKGEGFDSITVSDAVSGKTTISVRPKTAAPITLNGKKVYKSSAVSTQAQAYVGKLSLDNYLFEQLNQEISSISKEALVLRLRLANVIVDENGKVVYYEFHGLHELDANNIIRTLRSDNMAQSIQNIISNAPAMQPAKYKGNKVASYYDAGIDLYEIQVERNLATYEKTKSNHFSEIRAAVKK